MADIEHQVHIARIPYFVTEAYDLYLQRRLHLEDG
jgi:hypothetical protein